MKTDSVFLEFEAWDGSGLVFIRADKIIAVLEEPKEERESIQDEICNIYTGGGENDYISVKGNAKDIINKIELKLKEMF